MNKNKKIPTWVAAILAASIAVAPDVADEHPKAAKYLLIGTTALAAVGASVWPQKPKPRPRPKRKVNTGK